MKNSKAIALSLAVLASGISLSAHAQVRITEWMYNPVNSGGEFIEFTNMGSAAVDFGSLSYNFDDDSRAAGTVSLAAFGVVNAGQSVILTESTAAVFRTTWALASSVKVIGSNTTNLGRADEINLFSGVNLVDRLTYNDAGTGAVKGPRTQGTSGRPGSFAAIGANDASKWVFSVVGDVEKSYLSSGTKSDIGSPGFTSFAAAVPEPETYAMLLAGLGLIGAAVRRRQK